MAPFREKHGAEFSQLAGLPTQIGDCQLSGVDARLEPHLMRMESLIHFLPTGVVEGRQQSPAAFHLDHRPMRDGHPAAREPDPTTHGVEGEHQAEEHSQPGSRSGTGRRGGG